MELGWDPRLIVLSYVISVFASYAALNLAGAVTSARKRRGRVAWLLFGAVAMGAGIISMHYIGMAAVRMLATISYDPLLVALSGFIAVGASISALCMAFVARGPCRRPHQERPVVEVRGAVVMGVAIAGMHYTGMAAQEDAFLGNGSSGRPPLMMSVNLSARQFGDKNLVRDVVTMLEETGLAPEFLILEITQSVVMDDAPNTADVLRELKPLGIFLSIDDFGTGYSSLSYLKRFPVDYLKVDRSFVGNIAAKDEASEDAVISSPSPRTSG